MEDRRRLSNDKTNQNEKAARRCLHRVLQMLMEKFYWKEAWTRDKDM